MQFYVRVWWREREDRSIMPTSITRGRMTEALVQIKVRRSLGIPACSGFEGRALRIDKVSMFTRRCAAEPSSLHHHIQCDAGCVRHVQQTSTPVGRLREAPAEPDIITYATISKAIASKVMLTVRSKSGKT